MTTMATLEEIREKLLRQSEERETYTYEENDDEIIERNIDGEIISTTTKIKTVIEPLIFYDIEAIKFNLEYFGLEYNDYINDPTLVVYDDRNPGGYLERYIRAHYFFGSKPQANVFWSNTYGATYIAFSSYVDDRTIDLMTLICKAKTIKSEVNPLVPMFFKYETLVGKMSSNKIEDLYDCLKDNNLPMDYDLLTDEQKVLVKLTVA